MDITLHYTPHAGQKQLHDSKVPYRTALCGRRWGKSLAAAFEIIRRVNDPDIKMAWLAPSYSTCEVGVDAMRHICRSAGDFVKFTGNSPRVAKFINGVKVPFFSLDRPDFLRGKGFDCLIIDESELIRDKTYYDVITPTLAQSLNPEILAISTPRRKNSWFYKSYERGLDTDRNPKFESFQFPSSSNPYLSREYLEEQKSILPTLTYKREYLAEYVEDDSEIFKNIWSCINETIDPTCDHASRSIGCDFAKMEDYCVYTSVCTHCGRVLDFERFNRTDWLTVVDKLLQFQVRNTVDTNNPPIIFFDSTGIGNVLNDMIANKGIRNANAYIFTNPSKHKLITDLMALFDHKKISFSAELADLTFELQVFQCIVSASGNYIYSAPDGVHDDCVFSLALACQGLIEDHTVKPWVYDPDAAQNTLIKKPEQIKEQQYINFINGDGSDIDPF